MGIPNSLALFVVFMQPLCLLTNFSYVGLSHSGVIHISTAGLVSLHINRRRNQRASSGPQVQTGFWASSWS